MEEWRQQINQFVNTVERLEEFVNVSDEERRAIASMQTKWGTTPYFASLMDRDDPTCPIRRQVIPSLSEKENRYGIPNYLIFKENRATDEVRPDSIARQYEDRVAFTVTEVCGVYCRHCFRRELVLRPGHRAALRRGRGPRLDPRAHRGPGRPGHRWGSLHARR